jgi:hypothetical protein
MRPTPRARVIQFSQNRLLPRICYAPSWCVTEKSLSIHIAAGVSMARDRVFLGAGGRFARRSAGRHDRRGDDAREGNAVERHRGRQRPRRARRPGSDAALTGAVASHAGVSWTTSSSPGAGTSVMFRRCAASSAAADGIVYRFAFRCRQSNIKITKSLPGESVGQAELSSREKAKRGRQKGAPGRKTTAAVERAGGGGCSGRARGARAREICRMT